MENKKYEILDRILRSLLDGIIVILVLLAFIALLTWMQERDLEDKIEIHKTESKRVTKMLADCMNGKALFDYNTNTAMFCGKVLEMKL